jgi:carbamate kinase
MIEQKGGFRRLVPSPKPVDIVESAAIKKLFAERHIVVAAGGGGVPVIRKPDGTLHGVQGVVDKDLAAAVLARIVDADILLILTAVDRVMLDFGTPHEKPLDRLSVQDAKRYLAEGQFAEGSMGPKIEAAVRFVEEGGERTIITSLELAVHALKGKAGTVIC